MKSRGDQKGGDLSRRDVEKLARNRAMSPICCEITGQRVRMASRLTGRRDGGEKRGDVRKGQEEKKGPILFPPYLYFLCPFFLSSLAQLSLSLSLYVYRCIHIRTSFEIFLRSILVDASIDTVQGNPISAYTSAEIVAPFDRWNHLESSPVEIG